MAKVELLAPAGNLDKLKTAIIYGADAVYCGGFNYGLRAGADNFSFEDIAKGTRFVHQKGKRIYITVNMIPHNEDLTGLPRYLTELEKLGVDGLIVADPGVLRIIKQQKIKIPVHLSTQANTVNWQSACFWEEQGLKRIILARELSQKEIKEIRQKVNLELEIFIHGAMCISYSGRCLLSNYLTHRDANRGLCAHPCRWQYYLMEKERPGEYFPLFEDERGTHIFNSRDLCLIKHIPEIVACRVNSLKIEGRMKGLHYVAVVTVVYRQALDEYFKNPGKYKFKEKWLAELKKISHRSYTTGFFTGNPREKGQRYESSAYRRTYDFMGVVRDYDSQKKEAVVEVKNKFFVGDRLEIIGPGLTCYQEKVSYIVNEEGQTVSSAPHPLELIRIPVSQPLKPFYIVRRCKK